ncbi:MAG: hypothetical protein H6867_09255 [Rhodospirillales bacterium]|nr:hypothetical protein [Rhodospirillales bacterium]MCB9996013.1 hypothetical protein [Rhodospirillales bacterium]
MTSVFVLSVAAGVAAHDAYATPDYGAPPIVLAQNEGGNQGFFGRIFNRGGEKSGSSPVFLDQGKGAATYQSKPKPFNFGAAKKSAQGRRGKMDWATFEALRNEQGRKNTEYAMAAAAQVVAESNRALAARKHAETQASTQRTTKKRMVYDPEKVWTYNPNTRSDSKDEGTSKPKIYNSSR